MYGYPPGSPASVDAVEDGDPVAVHGTQRGDSSETHVVVRGRRGDRKGLVGGRGGERVRVLRLRPRISRPWRGHRRLGAGSRLAVCLRVLQEDGLLGARRLVVFRQSLAGWGRAVAGSGGISRLRRMMGFVG